MQQLATLACYAITRPCSCILQWFYCLLAA